jgi:Mu transposase, C-terminal domain
VARAANRRIHATLRCRPIDRFDEDKAAMMRFPPVLPDTALRLSTRLARDHWVRVGTCDYSVHPKVIGRLIEVRVTPDEVVVTCSGEVVGRHRRSWAKHRTITDPEHDRARDVMRASRLQVPTTPLADEVEVGDLSLYDRATGVA